jgi:hypothetical protein
LTSDVLPSRGRDAEYLAKHIAARRASAAEASTVVPVATNH